MESKDFGIPMQAITFRMHKQHGPAKLWCWRRLESPLDCKEIQPVHPKGNRSRMFIGGTDAEAESPILGPPNAKN